MKSASAILSAALCACILAGCSAAGTSSPTVSSSPTDSTVPTPSPADTVPSTSAGEAEEAPSVLSPDLDELESLLGESEILYWLPDEYSLGTTDLDQTSIYAIASQWLRMYAERSGQEIPLNENGTPYFPIADYSTVTEEVLGIPFDYNALAAQNSDVAPQDMLCVMWGYGTAYSELTVQKDSLETSDNQFSVIVENSVSSPGDDPDIQIKRLHFTANPSYRFSPYCLVGVEDLSAEL